MHAAARVICSVSICLASFNSGKCSLVQAQSVTFTPASKEQHAAYFREVAKAVQLMKSGKHADAARYLKNSQTIPHNQDFGEEFRILDVLGKCPLDPDAHIALGLYYMRWSDPRWISHRPSTLASWTPQADYEFMAAIDLSPNHRNPEAESYIHAASKLRSKLVPIRGTGRADLCSELLRKNWNPPVHSGCLIARADIDTKAGYAYIIVPSASKEFDDSVLRALNECFRKNPSLPWGPNNLDYAFLSKGTTKLVEDNPRSIDKFN